MLRIFVIIFVSILVGCEATAVKESTTIQTQKKLAAGVTTPIQLPVAYYVDNKKPNKGVNFFGILEKVTNIVAGDMFTSAEKVSTRTNFQYLLRLKTNSSWDRFWGRWNSNLWLNVVDRQGNTIYTTSANTSSGGGLYDFNAVHNSLALSVKEMLIGFLNDQGQAGITQAVNSYQSNSVPLIAIKELIKDLEPSSSGTGFFINQKGNVVTAAHVVDECVYVEVLHKGKHLKSDVRHASALLDLAVIKTDYTNSQTAILGNHTAPVLGKQVFVAGFPLSDILSNYPSLTMGNISSIGGLKGGKGDFQFSAPIQPGNSGGAIVDYHGNLVGVVSSTLNQAMMLRETNTTSQNVNFGIELALLKKFLNKHQVRYSIAESNVNFEKASADAVEYTNQVLCYN